MPLFNFTLTLSGVTSSTPGLEDTLHSAGCDDALTCFYGTAVYLEFDRERETLEQAILSAITDIESAATLNARVESVDSTLVGLSDIAELTGLSRQAISLLKDGARGAGQFPGPVQRVKGSSPLWRWQTIVDWLVSQRRISRQSPIIAHARTLDSLNLALQLRASRESNTVLRYFHALDPTSSGGVTPGDSGRLTSVRR
ncbi:TPA: helix-turn-helix transcriptional regulator [Citrobacter freundii]